MNNIRCAYCRRWTFVVQACCDGCGAPLAWQDTQAEEAPRLPGGGAVYAYGGMQAWLDATCLGDVDGDVFVPVRCGPTTVTTAHGRRTLRPGERFSLAPFRMGGSKEEA